MGSLFFDGWESLFRVALSAVVIYVVIVAMLRIIGSRALAEMSGYDVVVTVAIGSVVAMVPLTPGLPLANGLAAVVAFLLLQELTRALQARFIRVHHAVRERPHLVLWDGELLLDRMRAISVTPDEVRAAVRRAGMYSLADAQAVVLENGGEWSVVQRGQRTDLSAMEGLNVPDRLPSGAPGDRWRAALAEHSGDGAGAAERYTPPPGARGPG